MHMSGFKRLAAACLAACLAASIGPGAPAWAGIHDKIKHSRHQAHQAHARAHQLEVRARQQQSQLVSQRARLDRLNARANTALAELQSARLAADKAKAAADIARAHLAEAQARTAVARQKLEDMAADAYRTIAAGGKLGTTLSLVETGDPQAFVDGLQMLGQVGQSEAEVVDELRVAEAAELRSQHIAIDAEDRALATARVAATAKQKADHLVAAQQRLLRHTRALLVSTRQAHSQALARERRIQARIAAFEARLGAGPIPTCKGGVTTGYSNGNMPASALCALWGAPGQMLRADAAAAFNRMSKAFAGAFGTPLCVTSSYRTYQHQVELYNSMPAGYAAKPGTSNHGWGLAVDLCGGIQQDGSPQHQWLLDHAAAYNWFHPAWAMPGGPGPHEPWHWEYAG